MKVRSPQAAVIKGRKAWWTRRIMTVFLVTVFIESLCTKKGKSRPEVKDRSTKEELEGCQAEEAQEGAGPFLVGERARTGREG